MSRQFWINIQKINAVGTHVQNYPLTRREPKEEVLVTFEYIRKAVFERIGILRKSLNLLIHILKRDCHFIVSKSARAVTLGAGSLCRRDVLGVSIR